MKLPLLVSGTPNSTTPIVLMGAGDWIVETNAIDSKIGISLNNLPPEDIREFTLYEPTRVQLVFLERGSERSITVYGVKLSTISG